MEQLSRPYISIKNEAGLSYGGDQTRFSGRLGKVGCGIIAAGDIALYLSGQTLPLSWQEYRERIAEIQKGFFVIPGHGIPTWLYPFCLGGLFKREGIACRVSGGVSKGELRRAVACMLKNDIPVPLCVGPSLPLVRSQKGVPLYATADPADRRPAARAQSHFMVITGLFGNRLRVSSWGKEYYLDLDELLAYRKLGLATNICRIRRV